MSDDEFLTDEDAEDTLKALAGLLVWKPDHIVPGADPRIVNFVSRLRWRAAHPTGVYTVCQLSRSSLFEVWFVPAGGEYTGYSERFPDEIAAQQCCQHHARTGGWAPYRLW